MVRVGCFSFQWVFKKCHSSVHLTSNLRVPEFRILGLIYNTLYTNDRNSRVSDERLAFARQVPCWLLIYAGHRAWTLLQTERCIPGHPTENKSSLYHFCERRTGCVKAEYECCLSFVLVLEN